MKEKTCSALTAILAIGAISCSSGPEVRSEAAPGAKLASYHTYAWAPPSQLEQPLEFTTRKNDILDQSIKTSVNQWLAKNGLKEDPSNPDLKVAYAVRIKNEVTISPGFYPEPFFSYWNTQPVARVNQQRRESIDIDLLDAKSGKLVWRGIAVSDADQFGEKPEQIQQALNDVFKKFPTTS